MSVVRSWAEFMEKYQPERWKRWVHLMQHHPNLADRPCGCDTVVQPGEIAKALERSGDYGTGH